MNLTDRYFRLGIEGIPATQLQRILMGTDSVKVKLKSNGIIMLNNNRVIKCVSEYYGRSNQPKMKKMSNQCFAAQQSLGLEGISSYDCARCHIRCIDMQEQGHLFRKK